MDIGRLLSEKQDDTTRFFIGEENVGSLWRRLSVWREFGQFEAVRQLAEPI